MQKLGEIWDYVMRRKLIFGAILLVVLNVGMWGGRWLAPTPNAGRSQELPTSSETTYNNSLILQLVGSSGTPSYQLEFVDDFSIAKISLSSAPLTSDAYVRILTPENELVIPGEYTVAQDETPLAPEDPQVPEDDPSEPATPISGLVSTLSTVEYVFPNAPRQYSLNLQPGYIIEVHSAEARLISTLSGKPATEFQPNLSIERYVVTTSGLRKAAWSEAEGEDAMYHLLRDYLVAQIAHYQATISDEVLNNKNLDLATKAQIVAAYYQLRPIDQAPYQEFVEHLLRGGSPVITYLGAEHYELGAAVDLAELVTAYDNEDGELDRQQILIDSQVDWQTAGVYPVVFTAIDSDGNYTVLNLEIQVGTPERPEVIPTQPDPGLEEENSLTDPVPEPTTSGTLGGGGNTTSSYSATTNSRPATDWTVDEEPAAPASSTTTTKPSQPTSSTTDAAASDDQPQSGFPFKQIILIGFGVLLFYGLIRFIFDHYVR